MYIEQLNDVVLKGKLKKFVYDIVGCCQEVHSEKGPELTEYVYQDCLKIAFEDTHIPYKKEHHFHPTFRGRKIDSTLRVDFFCKDKVFLECKAIEEISFHERIQLTNYMRNAGIRIGILYNFAPVIAECEKFYLDIITNTIYYF
jgi:GxxExxY protein